MVTTVLGSCVTIIMYDFYTKISGMSHCIFPTQLNIQEYKPYNEFRYVDTTIVKMLELMGRYKIPKNRIVVKLFGGAEQLHQSKQKSVGRKNIEMAMSTLEGYGMSITAMDVGGNEGRKIYLSSQTGEVLLSRLGGIKLVKLDKVT